MSPLYHLQVGALIASARGYDSRERRLIMLASLLPDLDGIFIYPPELWEKLHHTFSNNLTFCLLVGAVFAVLSKKRRLEMFIVCSVTASLQLAIDLVTNDPSWPHAWLWPFSKVDLSLGNYIHYEHLRQITVIGVQGVLMVAILAGTIILYLKKKRTFLELISANLDRFLTDFIVFSFSKRCDVCGARAYYRDAETGAPLCPAHSSIKKDLTVSRKTGGDAGERRGKS